MRRPAWFEPLDSPGEWIGFIGGFVVIVVVGGALLTGTSGRPWRAVPSWTCFRPSNTCQSSQYRVRNDSASPVVLRACDDRCGRGDLRYGPPTALAAGQVSAGVVDEIVAFPFFPRIRDWWEVRTTAGRLLGCLVLEGRRHRDGRHRDLVEVSQAGPCGRDVPSTPSVRA